MLISIVLITFLSCVRGIYCELGYPKTRRFFLDNEVCYGHAEKIDGRCMANIQSCPANRNDQDLLVLRQILCGFTFSPEIQPVPTRINIDSMSSSQRQNKQYRIKWNDIPPHHPGTFSFLASLHAEDGAFLCSGALIAPDIILTSAQCAPLVRRVRFGEHHLNISVPFERVNEFEVASFEIHPQFNGVTFENDIAIVRLARNVDVHLHHPIMIPVKRIDEYHLEGSKAVQIGYGLTQERPYLRATKTKIIPQEYCRRIFGWERDQLRRIHLCAGEPHGICISDLGAPLIKRNHKYHWSVIGIMTFGRHCHSKLPIVFTRVDQFSDWLNERLNPPGPGQGAVPAAPAAPQTGPPAAPSAGPERLLNSTSATETEGTTN